MLNSLRIQNFKSWKDTGDIQFGSLTGFFGTNSSGKTSILQFLLMLKQTVESSDRAQVLNLGDEHSYVELGTMYDVVHKHEKISDISFYLDWNNYLNKYDDEENKDFKKTKNIFSSTIKIDEDFIVLDKFIYTRDKNKLTLTRNGKINEEGNHIVGSKGLLENSDEPNFVSTWYPSWKFYGVPRVEHKNFPSEQSVIKWIYDLEELFNSTFYLGPLREYPKRLYSWAGERTTGVGRRGEKAISALLASKNFDHDINKVLDNNYIPLEESVAYWLKELGLIYSFEVRPIAPNRKEYEVRIKRTAESAEVFLTDVGFGVSQLLPVLVLLFYVPEGSTIILEQPEIHLHPAVQAGLADVFIDAIKRRNVQIILESHSEHLLQRLQRRLAEEALPTDQVKLYFTDFVGSASTLTPLDLDEYGNIRNWPKNFFGDSFADASAMMDAELKRREAAGQQ